MSNHTAERVSVNEINNYVLQRSIKAYLEAKSLVKGKTLEIGTGSGYGIEIISPVVDKLTTVDQFICDIDFSHFNNVEFIKMTVPKLNFPDESFDAVFSFQVIEHIEDDKEFLSEISRVLKPGGVFICTTPNIKTSLSRNPWHVREYTSEELNHLMLNYFSSVDTKGVFCGEKAFEYYLENKKNVNRIMRFDIFNLQYRLPRKSLQWIFDFLNDRNRKKMHKENNSISANMTPEDYFLKEVADDCIDLFYVGTK
jgi:ubiquinone/menaquinone biosynthesis C-methylase UbiE